MHTEFIKFERFAHRIDFPFVLDGLRVDRCLSERDYHELRCEFSEPLPEAGADAPNVVRQLAERVEPRLIQMAHPRFFNWFLEGSHAAGVGGARWRDAWVMRISVISYDTTPEDGDIAAAAILAASKRVQENGRAAERPIGAGVRVSRPGPTSRCGLPPTPRPAFAADAAASAEAGRTHGRRTPTNLCGVPGAFTE